MSAPMYDPQASDYIGTLDMRDVRSTRGVSVSVYLCICICGCDCANGHVLESFTASSPHPVLQVIAFMLLLKQHIG